MYKGLLIFGAGQYGYIAKEIAEDMNCFSKIDFLDDNNPLAIGCIDDFETFTNEYDSAIVAIGNPKVRLRLLSLLEDKYEIATLIHPLAFVSKSAKVGKGSIVEPMAVVNANTEIGRGSLLCAGAVINHNVLIGDACQINCNSVVPASARVPNEYKLDCGEIFKIN